MTNYLNKINRYYKNTKDFRTFILNTQTEIDRLTTPLSPNEIFYTKTFCGSFHKSFPHNLKTGDLLEPEYYVGYINALLTNNQEMLENLKLHPNSTMKLVNPLVSLSTSIISNDHCKYLVEPCPEIYENTGVAEMLEVYSMAYLRDINFLSYSTNPDITRHINYLNNDDLIKNLPFRKKIKFSRNTLFRSDSYGCDAGPYISQFLYKKINIGPFSYDQKFKFPPSRTNIKSEWGVNPSETIAIQNSDLSNLLPFTLNQDLKYIRTGKDLGELVHNDQSFQLCYHAAAILLNLNAKPNPTLPTFKNQVGFISCFGGPSIYNNMGTVTDLALTSCWYQKWLVHRKIRPDAFSLLIHNTLTNIKKYSIPELLLDNSILADIKTLYGNYTLPMSFREGSPVHPSYPSGHAAMAGACVTLLKIFFDENQLMSELGPIVVPDSNGNNLLNYTGNDIGKMTIGTELNKLASNIAYGRNWAGVHYRSDAEAGMKLGEDVTIKFFEDMFSSHVENVNGKPPIITIRKFNGELYNLVPTISQNQ